MDIMQFL